VWLLCSGLAWASLPRYTAAGQLQSENGPWSNDTLTYGYTHDLLGLRTNIVRDLGLTRSSVSIGYDNAEQINSWSARESNGVLRQNEQFTYAYDKAGNLRLLGKGNLTETFGCDTLNQITNITRSGTLTVSGATPVPAVSVTVNGQLAQTNGDFTFACTNFTLTNGQNTFTIIAQNAAGLRVTNTTTENLPAAILLTWDSNGNLTSDGTRFFAYDPENRLLTNWVVGAWKTEFVYDGLGRRRIERDYGWSSAIGDWQLTNETRYVYDGWLLVQERDASNNALVTYTRGLDLSGTLAGAGGIGGLLARTDSNGSTFYHADGAGNITGLMDGRGNMGARHMYSAFGRLVGKWGPMADVNAMQFSSMPVHGLSGIVGYWGRPYDPNLQRWLSRDPIGEAGGINLYGFVGNNPISRVDPLGLDYVLSTGIRSASSFNYPDTGGPTLGQTASQVGSSWLDNLWNSLLGLVGMTMRDPTGDPRTQQQLNAMAQNAQQHLGSPMAQNGFYQPGSQEDAVGTGLFMLTPLPFMKGKPCPPNLGSKLDYVLGRATGSTHNIERSQAMLTQLESIGLRDTPGTRQYLTETLERAFQQPGVLQDNGRLVRDSLIMGPQGGLKMQSIWDADRLITVQLFGGAK